MNTLQKKINDNEFTFTIFFIICIIVFHYKFCDYLYYNYFLNPKKYDSDLFKIIIAFVILFGIVWVTSLIYHLVNIGKRKQISQVNNFNLQQNFSLRDNINSNYKQETNTSKNENLNHEKFDEKLVEKLIEIKEKLELKSQKQLAFLLLCLKENKYKLKSDTWFLEHFNKIFKIEIKAQFLSQVKSNIERITNCNDLSRTDKKYLKLYNDIQNKLKSNI